MTIVPKPLTLLLCSLLLALSGASLAQDITTVDQAPPTSDQAVPVADEAGELPETGAAADEDATELAEAPEVGPAPAASADEDLMAQFRRFQELMANESIDEADNVAKRVVELAIRLGGPRSTETAKALTNLGIVQQRTEQYDAAIQNFEGAIEIIEDNYDRLDSQLINPLAGLGSAQLANGRPDLASKTFTRAVHISHVNEGPHNIDQIILLESLAETSLLLGDTDKARDVHELIYNLNERYYRANMLDLVPSLMRRAKWQRRTGYINDERATYRRVIRILETKKGKNHISLIDPLMELGRSYYFVDVVEEPMGGTAVYSGEIYFKKAVRIAEDSDDATWVQIADTKLSLADYYMRQQAVPSARKLYREVWEFLSEDEERLPTRYSMLEQINVLNAGIVPEFAGDASREDLIASDIELSEGKVALAYRVTSRGRVDDVELVESEPDEFSDMVRAAQREVRQRIYRPRFVDGEPVDTGNQLFTHDFYYRTVELQARRAARSAAND